MGSRLRGLIAGIRTGLGNNPFIPGASQKHIVSGTVREMGNEVEHLGKTVKQRGKGCREAKDLMVACEPTVKQFIKEKHGGRHTIGSDIAKNRETKCNEFMIEYYKWLSDILKEEAQGIKEEPIIDTTPAREKVVATVDVIKEKIPDPGSWIRNLQIIAVVAMLFIMAIVYIIFVKGKGASGVSVVRT